MKFFGSKTKNGPFNRSSMQFNLAPGEKRTVYLRAKSTVGSGLPLPITMGVTSDRTWR